MSTPAYAVASTTCKHVACIYGARDTAEAMIPLVVASTGRDTWRVREASDQDFAGVLHGKSCDQCRRRRKR